jgi:aerobic-type carbon monoxide dehydrogenase small subunit (CoxS/CutS family)
VSIQLRLNGDAVSVELPADPGVVLLDVLRDLGLTGTKEGCGVGVCGACTVLVNDVPVSSCLYLAHCADRAEVWTVEGLTARHPRLLDAFVTREGMQCGICTSGQVVSAYALGLDNPDATEEEIREHMAGNLCRCTGYASIVESVKAYLAGR